jgi:hypothetical protein
MINIIIYVLQHLMFRRKFASSKTNNNGRKTNDRRSPLGEHL